MRGLPLYVIGDKGRPGGGPQGAAGLTTDVPMGDAHRNLAYRLPNSA